MAPSPPSVLFVSTNFPSRQEAEVGSYNLSQIRGLRELGFTFEVVAPRPWFPLLRGRHSPREGAPVQIEEVDGLTVHHPRVLYLPLSRGSANGWLYAWSIRRPLRRLIRARHPHFLWTSFAFPDGVGVGRVARGAGIPHVVSVVGSDLNANLNRPGRLRSIRHALREARLVLPKSRALGRSLVGLGIPAPRLLQTYNGVDRIRFRPRPRREACSHLSISPQPRRILFVGALVPVKNVSVLIEAFDRLLKTTAARRPELVILGDGYLRTRLEREVTARELDAHVRFEGERPHDEVARWMAASDLLCLPSRAEGVPNVILEAFASGRPVVASAVGGIPEIHPGESGGGLVPAGDEGALAEALGDALDRRWDPERLAELVADFTWENNARTLRDRFAEAGLLDPTGPGPD
jgi:glycosyltransferase involved in cell wall biosynthesis